MTEPTTPLPESPFCRVRARVASIWADGPDAGTSPDWRPAVGEKVTLTPSIGAQLLVYDVAGPEPIIVTVERVQCEVDADGWLVKADGRPVYIAPTDDPLLSATGWTWTATIKGKAIAFSAPAGGVVNLALYVATPAVDATEYVSVVQIVADYLTANPPDVEQAVADYLTANPPAAAPDATTAAKGLIRLAGDLGGTADAPTVPGLADKADTDHTHTLADVTDYSPPDLSGYATTAALASGLSGKADTGHGHDIGDVTGLQSALDGKQAAGSYAPANHNHDGTYAPANHNHDSAYAPASHTHAYADLTGKPTIPAAPGDIGAAPAAHDHTAADIDSGAAVDGHVLTADGAGGAAWEAPPAGGGSGSGIELVSGTVTLDATGTPIREFYATGSATINGVTFPAGTAVVWRRTIDGQWGYIVVDGWTAITPPEATATAPTFTDPSGTAGDEYTIPAVTGVIYKVDGVTTAAGTYPGSGTVTITAEAASGYTLVGTSSWTHTFSTATDPIEVTATAPTWTDDTSNGGGSWSTPTITGVTYSPASGTASPGQTVTVTATAQTGYQLNGTSSWTHTFPDTVPPPSAPTGALATAIMSLSPVGFWPLNETTGTTAYDHSGHNRHGSYSGSYTLAGKDGFALLSQGKVSIPDADAFSFNGGGLSLFILTFLPANTSSIKQVAAKGNASGSYEWGMEIQSNNPFLSASVMQPTGLAIMSEQSSSGAQYAVGQWQGVAVAFPAPSTGARFPLYIQTGTPIATSRAGEGSGYTNGPHPLELGARGSTRHWGGSLGYAALFAGQLTGAQVGTLMGAARSDGLIP